MRIALIISGLLGLSALVFCASGHGVAYPEDRWALATPQLTVPQPSSEAKAAPHAVSPVASRTKPDAGLQRMQTTPSHPKAASHPPITHPSNAAQGRSLQIRTVASLSAYTAETRYLSLPAYVRVLIHEQTGRWISYQEAAKMVQAARRQRELEGEIR